MTETPRGDASERCSWRLEPDPAGEPRDAERCQRERLHAALVAAVAERGYAATRVADVLDRAGTSHSTFYRHFDSLHDCFLRTLEAIVERIEMAMAAQLEVDADWDERLRGCFATLVELVAAHPAAAHLCLVDVYAAGPEAVARVNQMARAAGRRALAVLSESPERAGMPPEVARAVLGGLQTVIVTRVHAGRESELPELARPLMNWALGYRTPPAPLGPAAVLPAAPPAPMPAPSLQDPRRRIVGALTETVARDGYGGTTVAGIAKAGGMSLTTFYAEFDGKQAAFLAALDAVLARVLAIALRAYRDADGWPRGIRDGIAAVLADLSHEPVLASFSTAAGGECLLPPALARLHDNRAYFEAMLTDGLRRHSQQPEIAAEAIGASILALGYDDVTRRGAATLYELAPAAAFVTLAPALGAIEACALVNER